MADRCAGCAGTVPDVVVADTRTSGKATLQAADVLVGVVPAADLAGPTIAGLLAEYPGCAAVAVLVPRGCDRWCHCVEAVIGRALWGLR